MLAGLTPRASWLVAGGGGRGRHEEVLFGDAGQELHRAIELTRGLELRGRVVGSDGGGIAGCAVLATPERDWRPRRARTDAEGRFALPNCEPRDHRLRVEEHGTAVVTHVHARPGPGEHLIRVPDEARPSAEVTGTVLDAGARPLRATALRLTEVGSGGPLELPAEDLGHGRFRVPGVRAGTYGLALAVEGHPELALGEGVRVEAGRRTELGVLTADPPSWAELDFAAADGGRLRGLRVQLLGAAGDRLRELELDEPGRFLPLALTLREGAYTVRAWAPGAAPAAGTLRTRAGETTRFRLTLERGVPLELLVPLAVLLPADERLSLALRTPGGRTVLEGELPLARRDGVPRAALTLAPGTYSYEARCRGALQASGTFAVAASGGVLSIEIQLAGPR